MHEIVIVPIKCLVVDDEPMARDVVRRYIEQVPWLALAGECGNAIDALVFLRNHAVDLIFLDIRMPRLNGTEFVKALPNAPKIIFTTAYKEYAADGFELDAVDYLLKPISFERFLRSVSKAFPQQNKTSGKLPQQNKYAGSNRSGFIYVKCDRKMVKLLLDEILFIESARDYLKIFTLSGVVITRQTISSIEAMLSENAFARIHRSYIVSLRNIQSYNHDTVEIGGKQLPIGKLYVQAFIKNQQ